MTENTKVPLTWLITSVIFSVTVCSVGLRWTFQVDTRLQRIENKLGIPSSEGANAAEVKHGR